MISGNKNGTEPYSNYKQFEEKQYTLDQATDKRIVRDYKKEKQ